MSTSPIQPNGVQPHGEPAWKQEVNRRLAAHTSRKGASAPERETLAVAQSGAGSRAVQAAARVAARYAKAPSYSEMMAEEARAAVRAAEAASWAALEAQAAAETVLASMEAASVASRATAYERTTELPWILPPEQARNTSSALTQPPAAIPATPESHQRDREAHTAARTFGIRFDADLPVRTEELSLARASHGPQQLETPAGSWFEPDAPTGDTRFSAPIEPVEPAQPIHANLIEFPRELVATRKMRPRRADGPYAAGESNVQLSIFEVDPSSVSTEPEAAPSVSEAATPAWQGPEWSDIKLDAHPIEERLPDGAAPDAAPTVQLAPFGWRAMAAVVDFALMTGAFLVAAVLAAARMKQIPPIREIELGSIAALLLVGFLYQALFFTLAEATPGMRFAHISLCTFDDETPTRPQLRKRLVAMLLSVLPVGLGVMWAIFDEDHLCWHDRFARTYQRRS